jgi:hypothetical protein
VAFLHSGCITWQGKILLLKKNKYEQTKKYYIIEKGE